MAERQSARMSKISNDGLTRSGTGCFLDSCTRMATVGVKGLMMSTSGVLGHLLEGGDLSGSVDEYGRSADSAVDVIHQSRATHAAMSAMSPVYRRVLEPH